MSVWFLKIFQYLTLSSFDASKKKVVYNSKVFEALLSNLSKAFDCICRDLLISKLNVYGLSLSALTLIHKSVHPKTSTCGPRNSIRTKRSYPKFIYLVLPKRNEN